MARTRHRHEWLFAALPLLFAWHQFAEGAVWLALKHDSALGGLNGWGFAYMLYAQGLLPVLIPLGVWFIEPGRYRRHWILPFLLLGSALTGYQLWALLDFSTSIYVQQHSVVYHNPATANGVIATLYVVATCGSLFFSGYRYIVGVGVVNLVGVLVVLGLKQYAFTSIWCAYAAIVSLLIYGHFHRRRAAEARDEKLGL